jgi:uncharacterized membrane protein
MAERFWEIDSLRGVAIILMAVSNLVTDIAFFRVFEIDVQSGFWLIFSRIVVSMFILLAGVSLTLSYSRVRRKKPAEIRKKYLLRGARIFGLGMLITLVTWLFIPHDFVLFGILHMIGISIILGHFLVNRKRLVPLLGISFIMIGIYLQTLSFAFPWLSWLGFMPSGFTSVDYVPLLPWFGIFLIGIYLGNVLYPEGKRRFRLPDISHNRLLAGVCFLGRNSLTIYLLHQPVLIVLLWLLFPFPYQLPF